MALITLSSNFSSKGEKIAQKVSEQLGVELFDDQKLQERFASMGISKKDVEEFNEKAPGFFDRLFTKKPAIYLDLLGSLVYDIANKGEGVIIGHGSQAFLKDFHCAFHVMIHASEKTRSEELALEQNISEDAAIKLVRRMDKRFKDFVQYAFNRNWNDPSGFDLMINLDKFGIDWATNVIVETAKSEEVKECSLNALEAMASFSIQRKVDAAITQTAIPQAYIFVDITDKGKVHLTGSVYSGKDRKKVIEVAKNVPGVDEVTSDIFTRAMAGLSH